MAKSATLAAVVFDTTLEEVHMEMPAKRRLTVIERSPDMEGRQTRHALECSRLVFCRPDQCSLTNSHVDDNSCFISE
jgi:hypothetical protein